MAIEDTQELHEKLILLNRVSKVVKGGRRFSFAALMVVGDKQGVVGYGYGKAKDISDAIHKSVEHAKRNFITVPIKRNTIPHVVQGKFKSTNVLMRPAAPGAGIIAGGPVRAVMEVAGINDILSKSLGSQNPINIVKAVFEGFGRLLTLQEVTKGRERAPQKIWS